jgi:hypothetical protein
MRNVHQSRDYIFEVPSARRVMRLDIAYSFRKMTKLSSEESLAWYGFPFVVLQLSCFATPLLPPLSCSISKKELKGSELPLPSYKASFHHTYDLALSETYHSLSLQNDCSILSAYIHWALFGHLKSWQKCWSSSLHLPVNEEGISYRWKPVSSRMRPEALGCPSLGWLALLRAALLGISYSLF